MYLEKLTCDNDNDNYNYLFRHTRYIYHKLISSNINALKILDNKQVHGLGQKKS